MVLRKGDLIEPSDLYRMALDQRSDVFQNAQSKAIATVKTFHLTVPPRCTRGKLAMLTSAIGIEECKKFVYGSSLCFELGSYFVRAAIRISESLLHGVVSSATCVEHIFKPLPVNG